MERKKVTIVGAGNVGATTAHIAATRDLADLVLIDIVEGLAEGKALDLAEAAPIQSYNCRITGTTDWRKTENSDIVISIVTGSKDVEQVLLGDNGAIHGVF